MSAVLPPADDAAGLVLDEPAAAELRLEGVERQPRCDFDDHIDVERRPDVDRAEVGQPQLNRGAADEHDFVDQLAERDGRSFKQLDVHAVAESGVEPAVRPPDS